MARAAAANSRIQAIADWLKDGGDARTVDQIRADVLLDLLQGLPVPGPDGQAERRVAGDVDTPGVEEHPDDEINGDDIDDSDGDGDGGGLAGGPAGRTSKEGCRDDDPERDLAGLPDADPDFTDLTWPDPGDRPPDEHDPPDPDGIGRSGAEPSDADGPDDDTGRDAGGDTAAARPPTPATPAAVAPRPARPAGLDRRVAGGGSGRVVRAASVDSPSSPVAWS